MPNRVARGSGNPLRNRIDDIGSEPGSSVRFATSAELDRWDELIAANPDGGDLWRGRAYAELKKLGRYHPIYLVVDGMAVTVHEKRVPLLGRLWFLPGGPGAVDVAGVIDTVESLAVFARTRGVFAIKVEPKIRLDESDRRQLIDRGFRPARPIAPNGSTVVLDISGELDEVLDRIGRRARRSIRRAGRDGVIVERVPASEANCRILYDLLAATAGNRFGIRDLEYYSTCWRMYESSGDGQMFFVRGEDEVIAGAFAMKFAQTSLYKEGASVRRQADSSAQCGLGAHGVGHAMQWAIIQWARENGCVRHDMCGAPPSALADDPTHPLHSVGEFKRGFTTEIIDHIGAYDLPLRRKAFALWSAVGEREARRLSRLVRHDYYY